MIYLLPFLDDPYVIVGLQEELAAYLAACDGCHQMTDEEKVSWLQTNSADLSHWGSAVKKVLLLQVSSTTVERAFSLLKMSFTEQQNQASTDYLLASVILQYVESLCSRKLTLATCANLFLSLW